MKKYLAAGLALSALVLLGASCGGTTTTDTSTDTTTTTTDTATATDADTVGAMDDVDAEEDYIDMSGDEDTVGTAVEVGDDTETAYESGAVIPFSEVQDSLLDAKDNAAYSEFEFVNGSGDCADDGLFEFSYLEDEDLGYHVVRSKDGEYQEDSALLTFTGYLEFGEVPLDSGEATCSAQVEFGEDQTTVTCTRDEEEVCTATFDVNAIAA